MPSAPGAAPVGGVARLSAVRGRGVRCAGFKWLGALPGGWAAISLRCFALRCAAVPPPQSQPIYAYAYGAAHIPAPIRCTYNMVWRVLHSCTGQQYSRSMGRLYYRCMGRLYCVLGCTRLDATSTEPTGTPIRLYASSTATYSCTAAVGGAMAPMLPPYSCAPYICCASLLCVCVCAY